MRFFEISPRVLDTSTENVVHIFRNADVGDRLERSDALDARSRELAHLRNEFGQPSLVVRWVGTRNHKHLVVRVRPSLVRTRFEQRTDRIDSAELHVIGRRFVVHSVPLDVVILTAMSRERGIHVRLEKFRTGVAMMHCESCHHFPFELVPLAHDVMRALRVERADPEFVQEVFDVLHVLRHVAHPPTDLFGGRNKNVGTVHGTPSFFKVLSVMQR